LMKRSFRFYSTVVRTCYSADFYQRFCDQEILVCYATVPGRSMETF
jgi:hypothetical protein